jgi:N-acetylmuramoyl-L-alanine amidase
MLRCSIALLCAALAFGCASIRTTTPGGVPIDTRYTSANQDSRALFLVIHYTVAPLRESIKVLTEAPHEVSAHYLISDETPPVIYRLVPEERRAWHSGPSHWRGHQMLNAGSIGIEIVHPGFRLRPESDDPSRAARALPRGEAQADAWERPGAGLSGAREYLPFSPAQIDALLPLVKDIVKRHAIRPERIVGHSDVLPQSKEDPGPTFPWQRLADEGLIPWPDAQRVAAQRALYDKGDAALPDVAWFQQMLTRHGFAPQTSGVLEEPTRRTIAAFQMRFRPAKYDGTPDAETAAILHVMVTPP